MVDQPYRPDLKGTAPAAFKRGNPAMFGKVQGDAGTTERLAQIERRAQIIKDKVRAHYKSNRETWVAREAIKLWKAEARNAADHPAPAGTAKDLSPERLMRRARQNVEARAVQRLTWVNEIKTKLGNAVVRNQQTQTLANRFARTNSESPQMNRSPRQVL